MAKSKYPNKIDTSVEIPAVRDNILEVGSDVINSLRTAIFQIEKVLGVNPQGAVGNTVSNRISRSLDDSGNIKKEALDRAGLLSGPISNNDVSKSASILESKLRLNYPTNLLQDQISIINAKLKDTIDSLEGMVALLSAHVHVDASNRHSAKSISVSEVKNPLTSSASTKSVESLSSVQSVLSDIYSSHINFDPSSISLTNNSHLANQIYFDSSNVSDVIVADDVQEAIEDVANKTKLVVTGHQGLMHSSGVLRETEKTKFASDIVEGLDAIDATDVSFTKSSHYSSSLKSTVAFPKTPDKPGLGIDKSDVLAVTVDASERLYQISDVQYSTSGDDTVVSSVEVFGRMPSDSVASTKARLYRGVSQKADLGSLLISAREETGLTSAKILQIANPASTMVVSKGLSPSQITSDANTFVINIDGVDNSFSTYDASQSSQSIDSIISKINEKISELKLSILAYRVDKEEGGSEIAIAHNIPNTSVKSYKLSIKKGTDDGINHLGFSYIKGVEFEGSAGNYFHVNGVPNYNLGQKFGTTGLNIVAGTNTITVPATISVNFETLGVYKGDLLIITGSTSGDDGTYEIVGVEPGMVAVSQDQLVSGFSGELGSKATFVIFNNSVSLEDETFDLISDTYKSSIYDIFMDSERRLYADLRLAYTARLSLVNTNVISIVDFEGDVADKTFILTASKKLDPSGVEVASTCEVSIDGGAKVEISSLKDDYRYIESGSNGAIFKIYIRDSDDIINYINASSIDLDMTIKGVAPVNHVSNTIISRVPFDNFLGRVSGSSFPRVKSIVNKGSIGVKDVGSDVRHYLTENIFKETRYNGVARGLKVSSVRVENGVYKFDLSAGVCYVRGKRFEIGPSVEVNTNIVSATVDKFFIAIDENGNLIFSPAISSGSGGNCSTSLDPSTCCMLITVERSDDELLTVDLRIFVSEIDLNILNSITVSPHPGMGHFEDITSALHYAKRFSEIYPKAGTPTVHLKSGKHQIILDHSNAGESGVAYSDFSTNRNDIYLYSLTDGIWIDFPVTIQGEGESTVIDVIRKWKDVATVNKKTTVSNHGRIYIAGSGLSTSKPAFSSTFSSGKITIKDLKLEKTAIDILDLKMQDSESAYQKYELVIDNVTFDFDDITYDTSEAGVVLRTVDSPTGTDKGNLRVSDCTFIDSYISFSSTGPDSEFKNIKILNNESRGSSDLFLIKTSAVGGNSIFSIGSTTEGRVPSGNNIEVRGNVCSDNFTNSLASSSTPSIAKLSDGTLLEWGDRVSRNFSVGGRVSVFGEQDVVNSGYSGSLLVFDSSAADHMAIDNNEIQTKSDATTPSSLLINSLGGDIFLHNQMHGDDYTGVSEPFAITFWDNGKTTFGSNSTGHRSAKVNIITDHETHYDYDPLARPGLSDRYQLFVGDANSNLNKGAGIGFGVSSDTTNVGASIICKRVGSESQGQLHFFTKASTTAEADPVVAMMIDQNQHVGVGTTSPVVPLDVRSAPGLGSGTSVEHFVMQAINDNSTQGIHACLRLGFEESTTESGTDKFLVCSSNTDGSSVGTVEFFIDGQGNTGTSFTGQHWVVYQAANKIKKMSQEVSPGMILESTGSIWNKANVNQALPEVTLCSSKASKKVYGVLSGNYDKNTENLSIWNQFSGKFHISCKKDSETESMYDEESTSFKSRVNSLGEGQIWVTDINGQIENGDYICSSDIPGYGCLQDDDLLHNYTVAKCTEDIDWSRAKTIKHNGTTYKKYLCACTYHCG